MGHREREREREGEGSRFAAEVERCKAKGEQKRGQGQGKQGSGSAGLQQGSGATWHRLPQQARWGGASWPRRVRAGRREGLCGGEVEGRAGRVGHAAPAGMNGQAPSSRANHATTASWLLPSTELVATAVADLAEM